MNIEAVSTAEISVESIPGLAQYINTNIGHGELVQVSDVGTPVLQLQDGTAGGTYVQVSEGSVAPIVQFADQSQGVFITEGFPHGIQIIDGSLPLVQSSDGTSIIQLAAPQMVSGTGLEGLAQVVQLPGGQIALIEQQENIDPQNVQYVLEQVPVQQAAHMEDEMQQQQQQLMDTAVPTHTPKIEVPSALADDITRPPIGKGPFTCDICEKKCEKWNQYLRHLKTHDDDKPFRCWHCPATFNIPDNLKLHIATHVEPGTKPACPDCGKKFTRVASLKAHLMMHEREESLMCTECGDEFGTQSQLDRHMLEHKEDREGTRVFSCRQCLQQFFSRGELKQHTKQHYKIKSSLSHRTYKKEIDRTNFVNKCQHCSKNFQKPSQLQRHLRVHTGDRPFKCHICTKAFNQKGALQMHILGRHTDKKPHKCQFCQAGFSQRGNLRAHIQRVHTLGEVVEADGKTIFSCAECSCMFRKLGSLNAHISRFHTELDPEGVRASSRKKKLIGDEPEPADDVIKQLLDLSEAATPLQPSIDSAQLKQDDILQQALQNSGVPGTGKEGEQTTETNKSGGTLSVMNVRDTATGVIKKHYVRKVGNITWHQCTSCTKEFKKPSDLVRHNRIHSHEKPYKCIQCFRAFAVKSTLNSHIRTHTGLKQFKCNVCEKNFSTHGSLKVHLRLHTGAKPFDCSVCEKKFRTAAHLKNHMNSHFKTDKGHVRSKSESGYKKINKEQMEDIPMQEPILITDTGYIQQPPRNTVFNQYLGESGSVDRPYKCTHCQRGFKKSSHLKQHVRSHTGEKPYKCHTCSRTFVSNGVLKAHIRIHTGLKQYKCLMCEHMFSTNGSLKRHMSTHSDVRPFMCPYCQRQFKTSVNCKKHMKTHRAELALQTMAGPTHIQDVEQTEESVIDGTTEYVEEEAVDNELTLVQQDLHSTSTITNTDLGQQTILTQSGLQDALGLGTNNLDQQILSQQMFGGQQQTFTQSLLGSGQQNFQQVNAQLAMGHQQNQFADMQPQTQLNQIDLDYSQGGQQMADLQSSGEHIPETQTVHHVPISQTLGEQEIQATQGTSLTATSLPSTSMHNILQTTTDADADLAETGLETADDEDPDDIDQQTSQDENDPTYTDDNKPFQCKYCDKSYKKSSHLKQHIRSHTGEKPYRCTQCDKPFVSMGVLRQHLRTHTGVKEYKCSVCHAFFTTNGSLTRHMNIHLSLKPYKCPFCLEGFRTASLCKKHMTEHTDGVEEDDEEYNDKEAAIQQTKVSRAKVMEVEKIMSRHTVEDMNVSEKMLVESASERNRISEVKETVDAHGEKFAHQCQHCPKSFKKPSDLVRHIRIHTGEKPFSCTVCNRTFTVKSTLDSHLKTHGGLEKTIRCHVCNSMFSTKGSLKVHMRLHTGAKPFKCSQCPQRFRTSGHRKSHILQHYKPETGSLRRKRNLIQPLNMGDVPVTNEPMDFINAVESGQGAGQQQTVIQQGQVSMAGQVINIDQSMQPSNMFSMALTLDNFGNLTETPGAGQQIVQGGAMDGVQLQLANGNLSQGIQITGLDANTVGQAFQIDANLFQQLQSGNLNITLNPNQLQMADPNLIQNLSNLQVQPINIQEGVNPNLVIHPMGGIGVDSTGIQLASQPSQMTMNTDGTIVMANNGIMVDQQQQQQILQGNVVAENQSAVDTTVQQTIQGSNLVQGTGLVQQTVEEAVSQVVHHEHQQEIQLDNATMQQLNADMGQHTGDMTVINQNMTNATIVDHNMTNANIVEHNMTNANIVDHNMTNANIVEQNMTNANMVDPNMTNANMVQLSNALIGEEEEIDDIDEDNEVDELAEEDELDDEEDEMEEHVVHDTVGDDINDDHIHDPALDNIIKPQLGGEQHILMQQVVQADTADQADGQTIPKAHTCMVCEKTFKRASNLKEHLATHERAPSEKKYSGIHACNFCNKTFQKPSQLERHLRIHTGERPFVCTTCNKAFNQKNALQMHLKKHTGDKPHRCPYCNNAFVQKGNLKTHIKRTHHSEMVSSMNIRKCPGSARDGTQAEPAPSTSDMKGENDNQIVTTDINLSEVADLFSS